MNGFNKIEDDLEELSTFRFQKGDVIVCKSRVMFGYRLRAGFEGELYYDLDICCGPEHVHYLAMLDIVTTLISANLDKNKHPFHGIPPMSHVKPYYNDPQFCAKMKELYDARS